MDGTIEERDPADTAGTSEFARAKVNLALHVVGRRADGFHDLDSLVVFADVADRVRIDPAPERGVAISIGGPFAPVLAELGDPEDNLAAKAAYAVANLNWRSPPGIHLTLEKHLPVAAGLGGGSADAAATLRLLNRHWAMQLDRNRLAALASRLGADVPMCLGSFSARVTGIGDVLEPVALPRLPMVLVNPGVRVATGPIFGALEPGERPPLPTLPQRFRSVFEVAIWLRATRNDLFEPARTQAPIVGRAARVLQSHPDCLHAGMSGSGATCYGIFASPEAARRAADQIAASRRDWWVVATLAGDN